MLLLFSTLATTLVTRAAVSYYLWTRQALSTGSPVQCLPSICHSRHWTDNDRKAGCCFGWLLRSLMVSTRIFQRCLFKFRHLKNSLWLSKTLQDNQKAMGRSTDPKATDERAPLLRQRAFKLHSYYSVFSPFHRHSAYQPCVFSTHGVSCAKRFFFAGTTSLAKTQICIWLTGMAGQRISLFVKGNMVWMEYMLRLAGPKQDQWMFLTFFYFLSRFVGFLYFFICSWTGS